jgi:nitric oxide dioxygenase
MHAAEINLVRHSFRQLLRVSAPATALFYARLFELAPALRPLFRGDMADQGEKLMQALALAVHSLERLATLRPAIHRLGAQHRAAGAREEHYAKVGTALLWTLEKALGADFTPATRLAWEKTYALFAATMIEGARRARPIAAAA